MLNEKQKQKLRKIDDKLDNMILRIFEFDKLDVISLTKEEFKTKMCLVKMAMRTSQIEGMVETMPKFNL